MLVVSLKRIVMLTTELLKLIKHHRLLNQRVRHLELNQARAQLPTLLEDEPIECDSLLSVRI